MTKTYYSGDWYLTISNEMPMTNDGKTYCKFDLIKNRNNFYGCPVNQFGSVEEVLSELKRHQEISNQPEYDCIREVNASKIKAKNEFIAILENKLKTRC